MATVSRLILPHPALGTTGGVALHTAVEALYQKIGDAIANRWYQITDFDNGESNDLEHNFDADITTLRWDLYVFTGGQWILVTPTSSPALSAFTVAETVGFEDTKLTVTNVSAGNDLLVAVVITQDPIYLSQNDIKDVDITTVAPEDGQALVYEAASLKFKPGASGDASLKIQSVTDPNAVIKGGYLMIDDERELATYDGAGALSTDYGKDLTVSLDTILGGNPANATAYYLYIDLQTLGAQVTQTDTGRRVYAVVQANFVISTLTPETRDPRRYVPLGFLRSADAGTVWSGTGSKFGTTAFRRHETLTRFFAYPEVYSAAITSAVASNLLTHNLSGKPEVVELTYFDGTNEIGLDDSAHLLNNGASQLNISSLGLTFGGGQELRVKAVKFPQQPALASSSRTFTSGWFQNTATTTLAHALNDFEDIKAYEVQEWNVTTGRYRLIDRSALVVNFDSTNFYLDWTGLTPSATLQYRIVAGGSPIPHAIPLEYGGFTKFVGFGPGSYATLTAAVAASAPGDSILVQRSTTEPAGDLTVGVADLRVACKPGAVVALSGAMTNGLRLTAARIRLDDTFAFSLAPSGAQARGLSVEAADCRVDARMDYTTAQTLTDAVHITSGGARTYARVGVNRTAGTITNLLTNNDGAGDASVWGG